MCIWSHLDYCLLTDHLFGLIIIMQLIILSFYKKKLSELTFCHATLTLVVCSKKVSFWYSEVNLENTLFVSKSIIYLLPFLFNDWCLFPFLFQHNYETSWSSIGNFDKPSYKTNFYRKNYIVINVQLVLGKSNWREFKNFSHIRKFCQIRFLQSIEMNCELSDFSNWYFMIKWQQRDSNPQPLSS